MQPLLVGGRTTSNPAYGQGGSVLTKRLRNSMRFSRPSADRQAIDGVAAVTPSTFKGILLSPGRAHAAIRGTTGRHPHGDR